MIAVVEEKHRGVRTLDPAQSPRCAKRAMSRFTEQDRRILQRMLEEQTYFIDNPMFHTRKSARALDKSFEKGTSEYPGANARLVPMDLFEDSDKSIKAFTPLNSQEETALFLKLNYARYMIYKLLRARGARDLTVTLARKLLKWRKRELKVRSQLAQANIPLVLAMAKRTRPLGVDFAELIGEGNMALLRSIDKFDCSRGFKLSTYACRAILKSFSRLAMRTNRYRARFPVEFDPDLEKSDLLTIKREDTLAECVEQLRSILGGQADQLNDIERTVLCRRFAITDDDGALTPMTLEQVGRVVGVTKERVRQIQNKALAKLKTVLEEDVLSK